MLNRFELISAKEPEGPKEQIRVVPAPAIAKHKYPLEFIKVGQLYKLIDISEPNKSDIFRIISIYSERISIKWLTGFRIIPYTVTEQVWDSTTSTTKTITTTKTMEIEFYGIDFLNMKSIIYLSEF